MGGPINGFLREDGFMITVASEIMAILCLASDLKDLKEKHEAEKERTREVLRKTKWECSQEISNSNFAKFNRSIYKQARNGDLILDRKVAPVVTFDTPTRITK